MMDTHKQYLSNLCRICTNRAQSHQDVKAKITPLFAAKYKDMINTLFGINIDHDVNDRHPDKICKECYRLMIN